VESGTTTIYKGEEKLVEPSEKIIWEAKQWSGSGARKRKQMENNG